VLFQGIRDLHLPLLSIGGNQVLKPLDFVLELALNVTKLDHQALYAFFISLLLFIEMLLVFKELFIVKIGLLLNPVDLVSHHVECVAEALMLRAHLTLKGTFLVLELLKITLHGIIGHAMLVLLEHYHFHFVDFGKELLLLGLDV
jgi:hypothetical protein